jgi:hypothetical protein
VCSSDLDDCWLLLATSLLRRTNGSYWTRLPSSVKSSSARFPPALASESATLSDAL